MTARSPANRSPVPAVRVARAHTTQPGSTDTLYGGGIELSHLWRYLVVAGLVATCALLSTWSRVDLVETSVALDNAEARLSASVAERERLRLELATLSDPDRLNRMAATLQLSSKVPVVELTSAASKAD